MEAKSINQVGGQLGYFNSKQLGTKHSSDKIQKLNLDKVSLRKNHQLMAAESLSIVNNKSFTSIHLSIQNTNVNIYHERYELAIEKLKEKTANITENTEVNSDALEYYSPENTANRIYNFATSFYESYLQFSGKEDNETSRQEYRDIIGEAVDEGFSQALEILGDLPDQVKSTVEETHSLVHQKLDAFAKGEENTYHQKLDELVQAKLDEIDKDNSGDISIDETELSEDFFNEIDHDGNQKLSKEEISQEFARIDATKDLSKDLFNDIFQRKKSFQEIAAEASNANIPGFTIDFLAKNPKVAQAVIGLSGAIESTKNFAEFLKENPDLVQKIVDDPTKLNDVIRDFKIKAITQILPDNPIDKDFLEEHQKEVDNLFDHPNLLKFFKENKDAAQRLVSTLSEKA